MAKESAGILVFRRRQGTVEVLVGHAGGPFWAKKDKGAWDIPKGELEAGEDHMMAAKREFEEETGLPCPEGEMIDLGSIKRKDGKTVFIWAVEGDLNETMVSSNTFQLEWPPKSGQKITIPEIDRAAWFTLDDVIEKLHKGLDAFIYRLSEHVGVAKPASRPAPEQSSIF